MEGRAARPQHMPFPAPSALAARWFVCLFSLLVVPFVTCANDKSVIIIGTVVKPQAITDLTTQMASLCISTTLPPHTGAGAAGLQAAVNLTASGWNVTILEARARIGGRVWTETITVPGVQGPVVLDYGAMWIHVCGGIHHSPHPSSSGGSPTHPSTHNHSKSPITPTHLGRCTNHQPRHPPGTRSQPHHTLCRTG